MDKKVKSLRQQIAHNSIIQTVGKFVSVFLGVIALGIMTRYLGPEKFGQYTIVVAFLQFFAILADMGLMLVTTQMISRPNADVQKTLSNLFTFRFFASLIFFSIAPIAVLFFPYPPIVKTAIFIFTLSFFLLSLIQVLTGLFQKELKMAKVAAADIIGKGTMTALVALAAYLDLGLIWILIAAIIGNIFNFSYLLFSTIRIIKIRFAFDFDIWKKILKRSWPIAISIAFNLVYLKADTIILSLTHSSADVGIYGISFRFLEILIMLPTMFMGLILPLLSNYWAAKNFDKFKKILQMAFNAIIIMAVPMVVGAFFLADKLIIAIAGKDFISAAPVLKIIVLASAMVFIGTLYGHTIVALEKQRKMIWAYAATAALSMAAYLIFIPRYSYFGAAWATVFAETLIAAICFWMVAKTTKMLPDISILFKTLLASGIMAAALYYFQSQHLFLLLPMSIVVYFVSLYLLKGFSKELVREIMKI
ncbi:flippase [Candidatus Parcubacteria bacterium]|nr:flippase [Candidatus Parcubacteria bacterium]